MNCDCSYHTYHIVHIYNGIIYDHSQATWNSVLKNSNPDEVLNISSDLYQHDMSAGELIAKYEETEKQAFTLSQHSERVGKQLESLINKKFTFVTYNDMGFLLKINATLTAVKVEKYAQYDKAVYIEFIPKRKRIKRAYWLLPCYAHQYVIWENWVDPDTDIFKKTTIRDDIVTQTGYLSCSDQYIIDALNSVNQEPFIKLNCGNLVSEEE